ncbi:MAG: ABC transporter permease [Longimicrobiales bacterium]
MTRGYRPKWALRLFRLAMRTLPAAFRERFGDEMQDAFEDGLAGQPDSRAKRTGYAGRVYGNVVLSGVKERIRPTYRPPGGQGQQDEQPLEPSEDRGASVMMWLGFVWNEVRLAVRSGRRRPGFSAVVILTLALGIGANTAIFSVVNGVLLKPLPYEDPDELVFVQAEWSGPEPGRGVMSAPDLLDLKDTGVFEGVVGFGRRNLTLTGSGEPAVLSTATVTGSVMSVFRSPPLLGRDIRDDEFRPDEPAVVVVSHSFWENRLGGDAGAIGQTLVLSGVSYEIVGVASPGFAFPSGVELWIPRELNLEGCGRGCHSLNAVGRLAAGVSLDGARVQSDALAGRLEREHRDTNLDKSFHLATLRDEVIGEVRVGLALMLGAVGLVLLIACANVATLLLVRGASRGAETSVRSALGASRARLMAGALTESGVFAVSGGALGLVVAWGAIQILPGLAAGRIPRISEVAMDGRVLVFTLLTLILVTLLFGLIPALSGSQGGTRMSKRGQTDGRGQRRLRSWLLAGEVALCTVLLVGSGLLIRTFQELYTVELGYDTEGLVRFSLNLPEADYPSIDEVHLFYSSLEERVSALPGVAAVGSAWSAPLSSGRATGVVNVEGRPEPTVEEEREAAIHSVTPGWMDAMGISVLRGRGFSDSDAFGGEPVALINESLAAEHFRDTDPIGQGVRVTVDMGFGSPYFRIVGVIPDLRERTLTETASAGLWVPVGHFGPRALSVTVLSDTGLPPVLPSVREVVRSMDPALPMYRIETLSEAVSRQIAPTRFYVVLTAAFALLAAVLAAVGLYGVAAFAAARRTREIGLRVALGADRRGIRRLVIGQGMQPAVWGLILGLVVAYLGSDILQSLLYGVRPADPLVFVLSATLLAAVAAAAAALPARAASRTDPMVALRAE